MKLVIYGAGGRIGSRIAAEAVSRSHTVVGVVRHPDGTDQIDGVELVGGDLSDAPRVTAMADGADVVVSSIGQSPGDPPQALVDAACGLIAGLDAAGGGRFVWVGGAGSLLMPSGKALLDTIDLTQVPEAALVSSRAQVAAKAVIEAEAGGLDWTYLSPPLQIEPGERTGRYRLGTDEVVFEAPGKSRISMEDYAVALLDEIEAPRFSKQRFTVAY